MFGTIVTGYSAPIPRGTWCLDGVAVIEAGGLARVGPKTFV